jgi:oligopeptide/dipeptide ABC transporter ATP-binding protein
MSEMQLLSVDGMSVAFRTNSGAWMPVTEDVSFQIAAGEVYALVGESGCGKSVTAMGIIGLLPTPGAQVLAGRAFLDGEDLLAVSKERLCAIRGHKVCVIFQEPSAALNPVRTILSQLREVCTDRILIETMMRRAGFSDLERVLKSYPHELSGGMLQRVMIAMALLPSPRLLIADEPTTALDVTVQAQVMGILKQMCKDTGTGLLLITHNLGLVAQYADRVAVMYAGRMVESCTVAQLLAKPCHPYTIGLLRAVPEGHDSVDLLQPIAGTVPRPHEFDSGCRFRNRCPQADFACAQKPLSEDVETGHRVTCLHWRVIQ